MRVVLISHPSPFDTAVAEVLGRIDPGCHIARLTQLPDGASLRAGDASLVLVDVDAFPREAESWISRIAAFQPPPGIVALSNCVEPGSIESALAAGAAGYLPKSYAPPLVEGVLRLVLGGESYHPRRNPVARKPRGRPRRLADGKAAEPDHVLGLTPREKQVLAAISQGCTNLEIARRLDMKEGTVKTHLQAIFRKLGVPNRAGAALCGARMIDIQQQEIDDAEKGRLNLSWLQPEMAHRRVRPGEWIFRRGDVGSELFYVQRGSVALPEIGATVGPKDVFGEIGIFTPEHRRTCSARCETEVDLLSLSSGQVRRIYLANPQFALFILTLVATRLMADCQRRGTQGMRDQRG
jgi:DNA-binding NarL/FixJ family response regulator